MLFPADSAKFIAENSKLVTIKSDGIVSLAKEVLQHLKTSNTKDFMYGDDGLHPNPDDKSVVDWIFVIDTLNFCFWSKDNSKKWNVEGQTGYYALVAAIRRAIKDGYDITNPEYYSTISENDLKHILRGDDNEIEVPLLSTRVKCLHEVGNVLLKKYNGTFQTCVTAANKSALSLIKIIVEDFPCFQDDSMFKNKKVTFYKRAQILVSDLWSCFQGKSWGEFHDIEKLTMFADYRVPQALVHFGVLQYDQKLFDKLKTGEIMENGCDEEIEIRGCSIHAVELINEEIKKLIVSENINSNNFVMNSVLIDYYLWLYRRKYAKELEHIPFHKVYCCYY